MKQKQISNVTDSLTNWMLITPHKCSQLRLFAIACVWTDRHYRIILHCSTVCITSNRARYRSKAAKNLFHWSLTTNMPVKPN